MIGKDVPGQEVEDVHNSHVDEGLCQIIQVEGPMVVKRAHEINPRGFGVRGTGRALRRPSNRAPQQPVQQGRVVTEDAWLKGGLMHSIVREPHAEPVVAREREQGPRKFDGIPPSELQLVAWLVLTGREDGFDFGSHEHLRAVLEAFRSRRLTMPL